MKYILIISFLLVFDFIHAQEWTKIFHFNVSTLFTEQHVLDFQFISPDIGYFSTYETTYGSSPGNAYLYITKNSGKNWNKIYTLYESMLGTSSGLYFDFIDERNYFIFEETNGGLCHGKAFRDSLVVGTAFTPYPPPYLKNINQDTIIVSNYTDENYIFMLIPKQGILQKIRITDSYIYIYPTWYDQSDLINSVSFISGFGAAIGKQNGINFFYSSNCSYEEWTKDTLNLSGNLQKLYFTNRDIGFIICNDSILYRTQNGGKDWNEIAFPQHIIINDIQFGDTKGYIVCDKGRIASSADYGITWNIESLETSNSLVQLSIVNDIAYVIDREGQFFTNNPCVSVSNVCIEQEDVKIYPNPADEELFIVTKEVITKCRLFNNLGQMVKSYFEVNNNTFHLDLSDLSTGIYYLELISDKSSSVKKVLKN